MKILKNTTGSPITITDTGVTIPASPGSYTIPAQDYLIWAASSNVVTYIGSGALVVNDGSSDLSINNGTDLILDIFPAIAYSQGTATSGSNGVLSMGAVTTSVPTYTTGQMDPISITTGGLLRVETTPASATLQAVDVQDFGGDPVVVGTGPSGGGIPRVTVSNDSNILATQSGAWTTGRTWTLSSGTDSVAALQSGTWNINNISGTISLPTGASTEATLAKLPLAQGSTTSGQFGPLVQGAVTTSAPSYTTAQTSPLSLTTSGLLRVDASGSTIPISGTVTANQGTSPWVVSGTVAATQSGSWTTTVTQGTAANLNATVVGTGTFAVQAAQSGTWNITNISGTISLPTGAATEATLAKIPLAQGSTTSGQSGPLIQGAVTTAAPSYTTAQTSPLSLTTSGLLRVDASGSTIPISGTVTANQGTSPWVVNQTQWNGVAVSVGNGVSGTGVVRVAIASDNTAFSVNAVQSGTWNIGTLTSITNAVTVAQATAANLNATVVGTGTFAVQAAQSGTWNITNISGTISLPTGAATEATLAKLTQTQGSTTSGQSGPLIQGAVTTASPSYTTAQTSPLSLTTAGALRVDGSATTQPVSGTVSVSGTVTVSGTVAATQSGTWNIGTVTTVSTVTAVTAISNALPAGTNAIGYVFSGATSSGSNTPNRISSSVLEASHVIKGSAGNLYTITGYNSKTSSQFIQVFNSTTVPADTTVPAYTFIVAAQSNFSLDFGPIGESFSIGIAISNSSTAATKTIGSADCFFTVRVS